MLGSTGVLVNAFSTNSQTTIGPTVLDASVQSRRLAFAVIYFPPLSYIVYGGLSRPGWACTCITGRRKTYCRFSFQRGYALSSLPLSLGLLIYPC